MGARHRQVKLEENTRDMGGVQQIQKLPRESDAFPVGIVTQSSAQKCPPRFHTDVREIKWWKALEDTIMLEILKPVLPSSRCVIFGAAMTNVLLVKSSTWSGA